MAYGSGMDEGMSTKNQTPTMEGSHKEGKGMHDESGKGSMQTINIPSAMTGNHKWKTGDEIVLEVKEVKEDGSLEVMYAPEMEGEMGKEEMADGKKAESMDLDMLEKRLPHAER